MGSSLLGAWRQPGARCLRCSSPIRAGSRGPPPPTTGRYSRRWHPRGRSISSWHRPPRCCFVSAIGSPTGPSSWTRFWARGHPVRCASRSRPRSTSSTRRERTRAPPDGRAPSSRSTPRRGSTSPAARARRRSSRRTSPSRSIARRRDSHSTPRLAGWRAATWSRRSESRWRRRWASCPPTASSRRDASPRSPGTSRSSAPMPRTVRARPHRLTGRPIPLAALTF
jgi:hypothetical protein